jgi:SET domain-containing protein
MTKPSTYLPLPKQVKIGTSKIHGMGIFAVEDIKKGTELGITHVMVWQSWIRTPLGGFINHSEDPNCFILTNLHDRQLYTIKPIKEGQELTVYYTIGYDDLIQ